jgi:hypothetical protein
MAMDFRVYDSAQRPEGTSGMSSLTRSWALSSILLTGCTGDEADSVGAGGSGGSGDANLYTVTIGPIEVPPGSEATQCVTQRLPSGVAFHTDEIKTTLSEGSHHLFVYRSSAAEEQATPFDCRPFADLLSSSDGAPLLIAQKKDETLSLPAGVGFALDADQMVKLELHYINPTSEPMSVTARATFRKMDEASFVAAADLAMFAESALRIPPQSQVTTPTVVFDVPPELEGVSLFSVTGHQHAMGDGLRLEYIPKDGEPNVLYDPLYRALRSAARRRERSSNESHLPFRQHD